MNKCTIKILFLLILLAESCIKNEVLTNRDLVDVSYELIRTQSIDSCLPFDFVKLKLNLYNNSKKPLFIVGLTDYIFLENFVPLHENYGSYDNYIEVQKNLKESFLNEMFLRKSSKFQLEKINFPYLAKSNANSQTDVLVLYEKWNSLEEMYRVFQFVCNNEENYVPRPPDNPTKPIFEEPEMFKKSLLLNMQLGDSIEVNRLLEHIVFLEPRQKKTIEYDVSPFLLDSITYELNFKIGKPQFLEELFKIDKLGEFYRFENDSLFNKEIILKPIL